MPGRSYSLGTDPAAALLGDRHHGRPRRHAVLEVGPAGRRLLEGRAAILAGMLHGEEEGPVVGREDRPAHLRAGRRLVEAAGEGAAVAHRVGGVDAVGYAGRARAAVGSDPDA